MRGSGIFFGGMAILGLSAIPTVQAEPVVLEAVAAASATKAEQLWRHAFFDPATDLDPISPTGGPLSPAALAELGARLAGIAPAAGPENINPEQAVQVLKQLAGDALAVLNDTQLDQAQRAAKFQGLMARDFDIPLMARFALGRHWKRVNEAQRTAYLAVFSKFVLHQYAARIAGTKVASFEVLSAKRAGKRDVMVQSRIGQGNGQVLKLVWRMRQRNGRFRVIDVVAEGISLALTKRQEFAAIIKASGGDVAQLIDRLRQITA